MKVRLLVMLFCGLLAGIGLYQIAGAQEKPQTVSQVTGEWTGIWGPYSPEAGKTLEKENCKLLECVVVREGEKWRATFEGECGRPYKYKITMHGRQAGDVVLFSGSADLGEEDGGVYDWIGRATGDKFVGFFTSARYSGAFHLKRQTPPADNPQSQ